MLAIVLNRLPWYLLMASIMCAALGLFGFVKVRATSYVLEHGERANATIRAGLVTTQRRAFGHVVDLLWYDTRGIAQRSNNVWVSEPLAEKLMSSSKAAAEPVKIMYAQSWLPFGPVIVDDAEREMEGNRGLALYSGYAALASALAMLAATAARKRFT